MNQGEQIRILRIGNAMLRDTVEVLCAQLERGGLHDRQLVGMARTLLRDEKIARCGDTGP